MNEFINNMPKIELHAHLNGSLTPETLLELVAIKYGETTEEYRNMCNNIKTMGSLAECFEKFKIAHDLTVTKECLKKATICAIRDFAVDNVIYLELRTSPKQTEYMTKREYLEVVLDAIRFCINEYPQILVKLLPSIDQSKGPKAAEETFNIIADLLKKHPEIIKGIDLSGNPVNVKFNDYKHIFERARECGLYLAIHCGEITGDEEILDMLNFGMDRCGHGTFITGKNLEILKTNQIPIECCLSSNIKCSTVSIFSEHHFGDLYAAGHPVILCTDDFAVFDSNLSNEFKIAAKTFNLLKHDLYKLSQNAIKYSFANEDEKTLLTEKVENYFKNNEV